MTGSGVGSPEQLETAARLGDQLPQPGRFWIRYAPRAWPGPEAPWTDLARGALGEAAPRAGVRVDRPLDDLLYLPPADAELEAERRRTAAERLAEGTPVLFQLAPGEPPAPPGATAVYDLLGPLLAGDVDRLGALPEGAAAVWPLVAGLTDDIVLWREGCERLAGAGVAQVQPLGLALTPGARRRLAAGRDEEAYHALFHRAPPPDRDFARVAVAAGLAPFLPRPLPWPPLTGAGNRRLAGELILAAELWLAVGRAVGRGLALARAGRWVDASPYDVAALAREGNLGVVGEIDAGVRSLVEEWTSSGAIALVGELLAEYSGGAPAPPKPG